MTAIRIRQSSFASQMDELARTWDLRSSDHATGASLGMEAPQGKVAYFSKRPGDNVAVALSETDELTMRQLLAANGVDLDDPEIRNVTLYKAGEPRDLAHRVSVRMLFVNPELDRAIGPGDTVALDNRPVTVPAARSRGR
jgi:hypothetical protein